MSGAFAIATDEERLEAGMVPSAGMRIHYHTDNSWLGGSEIAVLMVVDQVSLRPDVTPTFTYRAGDEYEAGLQADKPAHVQAEAINLPDPEDIKRWLSQGRSQRLAKALRGGVRLLPFRQLCLLWDIGRMYGKLRRNRPDVLHVNNGGWPGAISCNATAIAGRLARVPVVVFVVNNIAFPYNRPSRWLDFPVDRAVVRSVDRFVTASEAAGHTLRSVLRLSEDHHQVIPNSTLSGTPSRSADNMKDSLGLPTNCLVVLVMARLEVRKGHRYLLDALAQMPTAIRENLVLLVVGDGPERVRLERQSNSLGLSDSVRFLGQRSDRWSLYEASDVVVLPSVSNEDLPLVILEAMAAARSVVATRVAGIPDQVVDGVTGKLVSPRDAVALAAALSEILADSTLRKEMGIAGRRRYDANYTPKRVAQDYWSAYVSLLRSKSGSDAEHTDAAEATA